ncbi:hypothetical protein [Paraburkholderia sp. 2C]
MADWLDLAAPPVTRGTGDAGLVVGALATFPEMDVVRQAWPMVMTFLKTAFVIYLPIVLVFGTHDLKAVITASCVWNSCRPSWFSGSSSHAGPTSMRSMGNSSPQETFNPLMRLNNAIGDINDGCHIDGCISSQSAGGKIYVLAGSTDGQGKNRRPYKICMRHRSNNGRTTTACLPTQVRDVRSCRFGE